MDDFENRDLWEEPSIASVLYDTMKSWEEADNDPEPDPSTERVISEVSLLIDDESDDQNAVYWNTLPKKLRIFLKLKFLDPLNKSSISKAEMENVLMQMGFLKDFVTYFSKENITTEEIPLREAEWWIGMCLVSSHEAKKARDEASELPNQ